MKQRLEPSQHQQPHSRSRGYTFTEVMVVLVMWSILILCVIPLQHRTYQQIEANYIINQLKDDILLTQQLSMQDHPHYRFMFRQSNNEYVLYDPMEKKTIFQRKLPDHWRFQMLTLDPTLSFNSRGMIINPGTMKIYSPSKTYKLVFSFGTSRMKIEEQ